MQFASINGIRIGFKEFGTGPVTIVIVAGTLCDHHVWLDTAIKLEQAGFRVIVFDNRDIGRSDLALASYRATDLARDILGLLDELRVEQAIVLGHSMGGQAAQELALMAPHRIHALILACTFAQNDPYTNSIWHLWRTWRGQLDDSDFIASICSHVFAAPALAKISVQDLASGFISHVARQEPAAHLRNLELLLAADTLNRLGDIKVPTLVISGEDDRVFPIHHSHQLANGISGAKHALISGAGHNVFKEQALRFEEAVVEFSRSLLP
jgi:3-oxoadipate enol-lactonase